MKKRIVTLLICVIMMLGVLPISAVAARIIDGGSCGKNVSWTLDENYAMTISGIGDMYDFDEPMTEWHIESVIIEEGVTSIGDCTFIGRSGMTSVIIPDSVTRIGELAFYYCTSLPKITIPANVTEIGENAFMDCSNLKEIRFEGDVPEGMNEELFSYGGITIYYPKDNPTWKDMKYNWSGYYVWEEYDPDSYFAGILEEEPQENASDSVIEEETVTNDSDNVLEEDVSVNDSDKISEEKIPDNAIEETASENSYDGEDVIVSILYSTFIGIFGVIALAVVIIIIYKLFSAIKDKRDEKK